MNSSHRHRSCLGFAVIAIATVVLIGSTTAHAQLVGELGVLDPTTANGGINPATGVAWAEGDKYRLAFVSAATRDATSPDIQDYHDHVTQAANNAGFGGNWYNIGRSFNDTDRAANAYTVNGNSTDIGLFLLDGTTKLADDVADLNNGPDVFFDLTEELSTFTGPVATGSSRTFGDPGNTNIEHGRSDRTNGQWWQQFNGPQTNQWHFYALSDDLTIQAQVVPEPASIAIWSLIGLGLAGFAVFRARRKK